MQSPEQTALSNYALSIATALTPDQQAFMISALNEIIPRWGQYGATVDPDAAENPQGQESNARRWFSFLYPIAESIAPTGPFPTPDPAPPLASPDQLNLVAFNRRVALNALAATDKTVLTEVLITDPGTNIVQNWGNLPGRMGVAPDQGAYSDETNARLWFCALIAIALTPGVSAAPTEAVYCVPFTFASGSHLIIATVAAGQCENRAAIVISTPFTDPAATLQLGTAGTPGLFVASSENVPGVAGQYESDIVHMFAAPDTIELVINPGASVAGAGSVLIKVV
jgi:hypothetical protein